ncbi:MAG TPA: hypothetical protein PL182_10225 [Pseudobdellovibrionaceae bacterium]|nr:hypothetical protein [Pseudobdellovibrionaceae bacterium]
MTPAFANEPVAVGVNQERLAVMLKILNSPAANDLLLKYGEESFVFDGMNWVNTFDSMFRYYDLNFKKFEVESVEKDGVKKIAMTAVVCRHQVIVKGDKVTQGPLRGCKRTEEGVL